MTNIFWQKYCRIIKLYSFVRYVLIHSHFSLYGQITFDMEKTFRIFTLQRNINSIRIRHYNFVTFSWISCFHFFPKNKIFKKWNSSSSNHFPRKVIKCTLTKVLMLVTCFAIWGSKIHKIHFHALYDVSHAELCCKIYKKYRKKEK